MRLAATTCLILGLAFFSGSSAWGAPVDAKPNAVQIKADALHRLQVLRGENVKRLTEIDHTLKQKLEAKVVRNLIEDVEKLQHDRHEYVLRQELLDRLILVVDAKFKAGDFREFIERALIEQAQIDATSDAHGNGVTELWKFFKYAAECIHRLPEPREDMIAFLEGYMKRSVAHPVPPEEYLSSRNYTNGSKSETGHPMDREVVGAFVDQRLQQLKAKAPENPASAGTGE